MLNTQPRNVNAKGKTAVMGNIRILLKIILKSLRMYNKVFHNINDVEV